jgi:polyisoprenoid-binding protein YceI
MKYSFLLILSFVLLTSFNVQELEQSKEVSFVGFKIKNLGINVDGSFSKVKIDAKIDKNDLTNSFINSEIWVESIETGMKKRDEHILQEDYFDLKNYKMITFRSSKIEWVSENKYQVEANLTIKGNTKKVSIPINLSTQNDEVTIFSDFEINRIDYGVGGRSLILGKTVKIIVSHTYTKQ